MRLKNRNPKRVNRFADFKAEYDGMVLYDAYEGTQKIATNMVRPSDKFWEEY